MNTVKIEFADLEKPIFNENFEFTPGNQVVITKKEVWDLLVWFDFDFADYFCIDNPDNKYLPLLSEWLIERIKLQNPMSSRIILLSSDIEFILWLSCWRSIDDFFKNEYEKIKKYVQSIYWIWAVLIATVNWWLLPISNDYSKSHAESLWEKDYKEHLK